MTRLKKLADLHQSLPDSAGKQVLSALLDDEVINLVQFQILAEQRARSRRQTLKILVQVGLTLVFVLAVGSLGLVWAYQPPGTERILGIGAVMLGALTTVSALRLWSSRSQLMETDEFAGLVMQAMQRRQKHEK
jgi:hypothetical protein